MTNTSLRSFGRLILAIGLATASFAIVSAAQTPTSQSTPTVLATAGTPAAATVVAAAASAPPDLAVLRLIKIYVVLLVAFPFGLLGLDIVLAYVSMWTARKQLMDRLNVGTLTDDQVRLLAADISKPPPGIPGLTRGTIAFSLLLIIGVAVFHMVVSAPWWGNAKIPESVDRILTLLAGALTSITGFYFGSKATSDAHAAASGGTVAKPAPADTESVPAGFLTMNPSHAKAGEVVSITGAGFGANYGSLTFGSAQATDQDVLAWTDVLIKAKVPGAARPGQMNVIVTKADGHQIATPPTAFTVDGGQ